MKQIQTLEKQNYENEFSKQFEEKYDFIRDVLSRIRTDLVMYELMIDKNNALEKSKIYSVK